jgi:hypothetical protein
MTRQFTVIKGKSEKRVSVETDRAGEVDSVDLPIAPFASLGWRLLCHVNRSSYRTLLLFSRQKNGKTIYTKLESDLAIDKYMAMSYYNNYLDKLDGIADVGFDDAFPKSKQSNKNVYIKRQIDDDLYLEIRNSEDGFDGFTVAEFHHGVRQSPDFYETLEQATGAVDAFEYGYRAARGS